jgi:hypothetical protein
MKVNLFADYRGVLTGEQFFAAGVHDIDEAIANNLVANGRAEYVDKPEPKPEPRVKKGAK